MRDDQPVELSIVMPCLNESRTIGTCLRKAFEFFERAKVHGEVIVADNGSTDGSVPIAEQLGARVVHVPKKGYGSALMGGIAAARGISSWGIATIPTTFSILSLSWKNFARVTIWSWATVSLEGFNPGPCRSCTAILEIPC